jgi:hypothetical protein
MVRAQQDEEAKAEAMMPLWPHQALLLCATLVFLLLAYLYDQHAGPRRLLQWLGMWLFGSCLAAGALYVLARLALSLGSVIWPVMGDWAHSLDLWAGLAMGWGITLGLGTMLAVCWAGCIGVFIVLPAQTLWRWWQAHHQREVDAAREKLHAQAISDFRAKHDKVLMDRRHPDHERRVREFNALRPNVPPFKSIPWQDQRPTPWELTAIEEIRRLTQGRAPSDRLTCVKCGSILRSNQSSLWDGKLRAMSTELGALCIDCHPLPWKLEALRQEYGR